MKKYQFYVFVLVLMSAVVLTGCSKKASRTISTSPQQNEIVCTQQYDPVCGADGRTYPNDCVAQKQNNVPVISKGECPAASAMTDVERKYLVWLLRARMEAKLPDERITHRYTAVSKCLGCYDIYYQWGNPETRVIARIIIRDDVITSAIDALGYNYLEKRQDVPVDFPELLEYEK